MFNKIFAELAGKERQTGADHDRRHPSEGAPHRCKPFKKAGLFPDVSGRTKGGLNSKLHAVCDKRRTPARHALKRGADERLQGRPALMLPAMPKAKELLADKGYDADWFRAALAKRGIAACIPSKSNRKVAIPYDALLYKQRHKIENMFGRLKDCAASTPDTTAAPTPTCRQSVSPQPSPSGSDQ